MNSLFLSTGDNPYAHLASHFVSVPTAHFTGTWATVEIQPDPFARQRFTVGVAVADLEGRFSFRLLEDLGKFECLYDRDDVSTFRTLIDSAEQCLARARRDKVPLSDIHFDVDALSLSELWPTSGDSADAVLSRLFADVVPFLPRGERKARDFVTLDNTAVRRLVDDALKKIAGVEFERISSDSQRAVTDRATGEVHWLDFNLESDGGAGSVISAVYKTPERIELNFLRASRDLSTYARIKNLRRRLGLFVMAPSRDSIPQADYERIENIIGEQSWRLEQQGYLVSTHDAAAPLAKDVWEWAALPG